MSLLIIAPLSGTLSKERDKLVPVPFACFVVLCHKNQLNPECNSTSPLQEVPICFSKIQAVQRFHHVKSLELPQNVYRIDQSISTL